MKKLILAAFAVSAVFNSAGTHAQTVTARTSSCGVWAKERGDKTDGYQKAWLIGYLSGLSAATGVEFWRKDGHSLDNESVFLWMDKYCRENPLKLISNGARELFIEHTLK